jgi:hypothetical protein
MAKIENARNKHDEVMKEILGYPDEIKIEENKKEEECPVCKRIEEFAAYAIIDIWAKRLCLRKAIKREKK